MRRFLIQGFRLFNSSIYTVLTFEFGQDLTTLKIAIFNEVDYIEIDPAVPALPTGCMHESYCPHYFSGTPQTFKPYFTIDRSHSSYVLRWSQDHPLTCTKESNAMN